MSWIKHNKTKPQDPPAGVNGEAEGKTAAIPTKAIVIGSAILIVALLIIFLSISAAAENKRIEKANSDIDSYIAGVNALETETGAFSGNLYDSPEAALTDLAEKYNALRGSANGINYPGSGSFASAQTDPWGTPYYITAKKTNDNAENSTYSFYIISAGKDMFFNTVTLVPNDDDICKTLLAGAKIEVVDTPKTETSDSTEDPNFGLSEIISLREVTRSEQISDGSEVDTNTLPTRVTITFNQQKGTGGTTSLRVKNGKEMKSYSITPPTRENYTFVGYFTGGNGYGTKYYNADGIGIGMTAFKEDLTLYAYWKGAQSTILFNNDGGSGLSSVKCVYGESLPAVDIPKKTGFTFLGYFSQANGAGIQYYDANGKGLLECEIKNNITMYASWMADSFVVEHYVMRTDGTYSNVATLTESAKNISNNTIQISSLVNEYLEVPNGIVFDTATVNDAKNATTVLVKDISTVVKLYYKRLSYKLNVIEGSGISSAEGNGNYLYGANVVINAEAEDGYDWLKWVDQSDGTTFARSREYRFSMPAYDLTVKACADAAYYTAHLVTNGGYCSKTKIQVAYNETYIDSIPTTTRDGYELIGWSASDKSNDPISRTAKWNTKGDGMLYAIWAVAQYSVTFNMEGGSGRTSALRVQHGDAFPAITPPTRDGYTFNGFYTKQNGAGTQYYDATGTSVYLGSIDSSVTLYASWTAKSYSIEYLDEGGAAFSGTFASAAPTACQYDKRVQLISPAKDGFTFGGWFTDSQCKNCVSSVGKEHIKDGKITVYAKWTAVPVTQA